MLARAKVFAFCCIDPRFRKALLRFVEEKFSLQPTEYDIKTDAGGICELAKSGPVSDWLLKNAELAYHQHETRVFVLCNHMGCSYYRHTHGPLSPEQEKQKHIQDIQAAAGILKSHLHGIRVYGYIASLQEKPKQQYIFEQVPLP